MVIGERGCGWESGWGHPNPRPRPDFQLFLYFSPLPAPDPTKFPESPIRTVRTSDRSWAIPSNI